MIAGLIGSLRANSGGSLYKIPNSLRFRSSASAYLSRTPTVAGNQTTWTWSAWVKRGSLGSIQQLFGSNIQSNTECQIIFYSDDTLKIYQISSGTTTAIKTTTAVYRDTSAWYHIVGIWDTTNATAGNRLRLYVNGQQITQFSSSTDPSPSLSSYVNGINNHHDIGGDYVQNPLSHIYLFDGYMTEINFIDGQALTPDSFGAISPQTGAWTPKAYTGTYGTNGFYLKFTDNSAATSAAIGKDYSGNYNNWIPNNISLVAGTTYDSMTDSPTLYGDSLVYNEDFYNALNFRSSASTYLSRTPTVAGNRKTWTWSGWVKRGTISDNTQTLFAARNDTVDWQALRISAGDQIEFLQETFVPTYKRSSAVYRDTSKFFHIVLAVDTTQVLEQNRIRLYVDGAEIVTWSLNSTVNQNTQFAINNTVSHSIGRDAGGVSLFNGYLAEVNFIDGQALDPSSFGETVNGVWKPKTYTGTYGTNGFYLKFNDNSGVTATTMGKDSAGTNNWTPTNFATTDITRSFSIIYLASGSDSGDLQYFEGKRYPYNALNFRSGASSYLSRTPAINGSQTTWTWSAWMRGLSVSDGGAMLNAGYIINGGSASVTFTQAIYTGLRFAYYDGTSNIYDVAPSGMPIDNTSKWYHVVISVDTTQSTASNRVKFYVDGVLATSFSSSAYPPLNFATNMNSTSYANRIGARVADGFAGASWAYFNGYLAEVNFIDGQALTPSSFGETINGVWKPKAYTGTYGTNGFYLKFNDNSGVTATTMGKDSAGTNNWTPTNLVVTDVTSTDITSVNLVNPNYGLQFRSAASTYLSRTPSKSGNRKTWTWSGWIKGRACFSSTNVDVNGNHAPTNFIMDGAFIAEEAVYSGTCCTGTAVLNFSTRTTQTLFLDPSLFYHVVIVMDTTQTTSTDRIKLYVNGVQYAGTWSANTSFGAGWSGQQWPLPNSDTFINSTRQHRHNRYLNQWGNLYHLDGIIAEVNFIDGQALDPSSFGETINGTWVPKAYTGTYGTNGFYLNFADRSAMTATAIGNDASVNSNNWTPNNFYITDAIDYGVKTARGNYATLNLLDKAGSGALTDGSLVYTTSTAATDPIRSTVAVSSGKWYWEVTCISQTGVHANAFCIGILGSSEVLSSSVYPGNTSTSICYYGYDGTKIISNINTTYGSTYTVNDVIGVALDMDAGTITFYKNNVSQGVATTGLVGSYSPAFGDGGTGEQVSASFNFGQRPFAYTPPLGFKSLNTYNLETPVIKNPATSMAATTYTGTGASLTVSNAVNGTSFQPDFIWIKSRSVAADHALMNSVVGPLSGLTSNNTGKEFDQSSNFSSFNSNGFTVKGTSISYNNTGDTFVAWQWKAGGMNTSNTNGTIPSVVNVGIDQGFSIVTYTGTGANATVGHGLGVAPKMIIVKSRNTAGKNWAVYHSSVGATAYLYLNLPNSAYTASGPWNNTSPTASVFSIGANSLPSYDETNFLAATYVAYCFAEVSGYSKFGSYTGNGSADGPFVYCGFRPKFVMIKRTDSADNWVVWDTTRSSNNPMNHMLQPDVSVIEATGGNYNDFLSNGVKIRETNTGRNASNGTYIFAAFAEAPFKYALAR